VHLIHGEDLFVARPLRNPALHPSRRPGEPDYEPIDGATASIGDVVACINTYALMGGTRSWPSRRPPVSRPEDAGRLLESARKPARKATCPERRSTFYPALASDASVAGGHARTEPLGAFFPTAMTRARTTRDRGHPGSLRCGRLSAAEAGMAQRFWKRPLNTDFRKAIISSSTTDLIDRRRSLYKIISEKGVVIDCAVPKGERRVDKETQEALLADHMQAVLEPARKTIEPCGFSGPLRDDGIDPGTFSNNLQILIDYAGERREITAEDVEAALTRTKKTRCTSSPTR